MPAIPSIEELNDESRYEKVLSLQYRDLAPFILGKLLSPSKAIILIWVLSLLSALAVVWLWPGLRYSLQDPHILRGLITGFIILPLPLIPLHEILHLIPFSISGARDIRFGMDLSQGIVYITAHRYVIGRKMFSIVAFTPLVIISIVAIAAIIMSPLWWKWVLSMTLFVHTTMCVGDAAMLGFTERYGKRKVYTWDDAANKEAYFYAEKD